VVYFATISLKNDQWVKLILFNISKYGQGRGFCAFTVHLLCTYCAFDVHY